MFKPDDIMIVLGIVNLAFWLAAIVGLWRWHRNGRV